MTANLLWMKHPDKILTQLWIDGINTLNSGAYHIIHNIRNISFTRCVHLEAYITESRT